MNLISIPADDSYFRRVESNGQSVCPQSQHPIHRSWFPNETALDEKNTMVKAVKDMILVIEEASAWVV
jgi:hypothetical protein